MGEKANNQNVGAIRWFLNSNERTKLTGIDKTHTRIGWIGLFIWGTNLLGAALLLLFAILEGDWTAFFGEFIRVLIVLSITYYLFYRVFRTCIIRQEKLRKRDIWAYAILMFINLLVLAVAIFGLVIVLLMPPTVTCSDGSMAYDAVNCPVAYVAPQISAVKPFSESTSTPPSPSVVGDELVIVENYAYADDTLELLIGSAVEEPIALVFVEVAGESYYVEEDFVLVTGSADYLAFEEVGLCASAGDRYVDIPVVIEYVTAEDIPEPYTTTIHGVCLEK